MSTPALPITVYIVDDERGIRTMISRMLGGAEHYAPHPFAGGADFLDALAEIRPGIVLLDLRMPDADGFAVMRALAARGIEWPVIVLTGAGDVPAAVEAMKLGASEFLEKPVRQDTLLAALAAAASLLGQRVGTGERRRYARARIGQLTARENQVLAGLMAGRSNKELADELGIGLRTVEMHRGNMMSRLGATSVAQVVALAMDAGLRPTA